MGETAAFGLQGALGGAVEADWEIGCILICLVVFECVFKILNMYAVILILRCYKDLKLKKY